MTKAELIKKIENLKDEDHIHFALFVERANDYGWRVLDLNAQSNNDPADTFGLVTIPYTVATIQEVSTNNK